MTEQTKPDLTARNMAVRTQALDMAIRANCGQRYDEEARIIFDEDWIVEAATKFENFINGVKELKKEEPKKVEPKKEGW